MVFVWQFLNDPETLDLNHHTKGSGHAAPPIGAPRGKWGEREP